MNPKFVLLCYVACSFQLKISWKICKQLSFCSTSYEHKRIKKRKKPKQFKYATFETASLRKRENSEEHFTSHFCLHVHLIEKLRSRKLISQKELKLLNLITICDLYSHVDHAIFVQCIKRCTNLCIPPSTNRS